MTIEKNFDISFVAELALREKQIQQSYRPIIAVHKWFARRPGSLFRGLLLAEFCDQKVSEVYFNSHNFSGYKIADPFMGGGIPLLEANRIGFDVLGLDINPMSAWIVREEIEHLDSDAYDSAASSIYNNVSQRVHTFYQTDCTIYGTVNVPVKYFLWVKTIDCEICKTQIDLFPGYLVSKNIRHTKNIIVCSSCGELNEVENIKFLGKCAKCETPLKKDGPAKRGKCSCPKCHHVNTYYPREKSKHLGHRLFAIEYYNPEYRRSHKGRFFKKPDEKDLKKFHDTKITLESLDSNFIPTQEIISGDETERLHKWGYNFYSELFNERQLLGLELLCRQIYKVENERIRHALATNLSDLLRYQNMLCRYDTMALKSLDIFSVHGFPVGLIQCESNLLGIANSNGINVGSGGWLNITEKYRKAKQYCLAPFEVKRSGKRKIKIPTHDEWIGETRQGFSSRKVKIHCDNSAEFTFKEKTLDAVFTDPPYFGNVQYGELMDFCYVWLRQLVGHQAEGFSNISTRSPNELTANSTQERDINHFSEGLAAVYRRMAKALKPGAPLAFTFHHNALEPYVAVGVSILDSGLICSASLPCPAEMSGSIHIHGTNSSIIDTVFVCRSIDKTLDKWNFKDLQQLRKGIVEELLALTKAGVPPSKGDIKCIIYGHLTRLAVRKLYSEWDISRSTADKLSLLKKEIQIYGSVDSLVDFFSPASKEVEAMEHHENTDSTDSSEKGGMLNAVSL